MLSSYTSLVGVCDSTTTKYDGEYLYKYIFSKPETKSSIYK